MMAIQREQIEHLDEYYFYDKLSRFVETRSRNPKLNNWVAQQTPVHETWHTAWASVRSLSEHDCALMLIFLAVCACEGIAAGPLESMIAHLAQQEVRIKNFLRAKGYFAFSDFEFRAQSASMPQEELAHV